jgi:transposase
MQYVGIDWAYRRAAWCAKQADGTISGEGFVPADEDGLARLVLELGSEVHGCLEMMSGAVWVRDRLAGAGWEVEVADARKVKNVAPLACKTDKVDARVLAELCRRELVPALWIPSLEERALRERLKRRLHLVRLRTSAKNRIFGLLTQWGLRIPLERLRKADAMELLEARGVPEVWRRSVAEALAVIELLDERIAPLEQELAPLARADRRVLLVARFPGSARCSAHDRRRDRRRGALSVAAQADRLCRYRPARPAVGRALALGRALEDGFAHAALRRRRSRPGRLARDEFGRLTSGGARVR